MALGVDGVRVGQWTHPQGTTGCTVVLPPPGTLGAIAVRGASPGTREAVALGATGKVTVCHAVVLSGGSAYGLSTADGVVAHLEEQGIGYPVSGSGGADPAFGQVQAVVPIVGAAILLDASVLTGERPDAAAGRSAAESAADADPPEGAVGAGAGCTVAVVGGLEHAWRSGQGWAVRRHGDLVVGALVANNALGEILDQHGEVLIASRAPDGVERYPYAALDVHGDDPGGRPREDQPASNTVIGTVVTNARLDKAQAVRVADLAHGGVVRAVRPAHTTFDGDALFCLATGEVEATVDLVAMLAADAVEEASRRGPLLATGHDGLPGWADEHAPPGR